MIRARGMSLVETMIALLVAAIVVGVVIQVFGATGVSSRQNGATGRLQLNARIAFQRIERDVRMATLRHCTGATSDPGGQVGGPITMTASRVPADWQSLDRGTDPFPLPAGAFLSVHRCTGGSCTPALPAKIGNVALPQAAVAAGGRAPDSDVIIVRYLDAERGAPLGRDMTSLDDVVPIDESFATIFPSDSDGTFNPVDAIITDCNGGDFFRVSGYTAGGAEHVDGNRSTRLSRQYRAGAMTRLFRYPQDTVQRVYYVGYSTDVDDASRLVGGLYTNVDGAMVELINGIDRMRVDALAQSGSQYGVVSPADVTSIGVESLRRIDLSLLVNGVLEAALEEQPFVFAGATEHSDDLPTGSDRRSRREVTWTMQLRNLGER